MRYLLIVFFSLSLVSCKNDSKRIISKHSNDSEIYFKNQYKRGWFVDSIASIKFDQASEESAKGNYKSAKKLYEKANQIEPNNKIILNALGNVSASLNDFNECVKYFDKSLQIDSTNSVTYLNFGAAYNKLLKYDKSIEVLNKGIQFETNEERLGYFYYNLANSYYKIKDYKLSYEFVNKALFLVKDKAVIEDITELKLVLSDLNNF